MPQRLSDNCSRGTKVPRLILRIFVFNSFSSTLLSVSSLQFLKSLVTR